METNTTYTASVFAVNETFEFTHRTHPLLLGTGKMCWRKDTASGLILYMVKTHRVEKEAPLHPPLFSMIDWAVEFARVYLFFVTLY